MNMKISLVALGVMGLMTLGMASDTHATSDEQAKKEPTKDDHKVVTVKAGDTLSSIADAHDTTYAVLYNANESILNPDVIDVGDEVRIPKQDEELPDRFAEYQASLVIATPAIAAPIVSQTATTYTTSSYTAAPVNSTSYYVGNGMWCTDYVHSKRPDVPIYDNAGYSWITAAQAEGKATGTTPRAGAVAVMNGHVAYVESVNPDGSYVVSEMGWNYQAGNYNQRTVQPGTFGGFIY